METIIKAFLAHIIIFFISIYILLIPYEYIEKEMIIITYGVIHILTVISLYIISGYFITPLGHRLKYWNYLIVLLVGICIWGICFGISPNELDWRRKKSGVWVLYSLYIAGLEVPFGYARIYFLRSMDHKAIAILGFSFVPSMLQMVGGVIKNIKNKHEIL